MPTTFIGYTGPFPSDATMVMVYAAAPQFTTGGPGALPVPVASVLHDGVVGTAYSETISAQGGVSPYTFSVVSGSLPAGLSLSSGSITGTPTTAGTSTFSIQATDANGSTGTKNFSITVAAPASGGATNYAFVS